jgi:cell wall-associated NlpC family hydrolase
MKHYEMPAEEFPISDPSLESEQGAAKSERRSFRQFIRESRLGRAAVGALFALSIASGTAIAESAPASAETLSASEYNGHDAAKWALAHAEDRQKYGEYEDCTWFVSQALWAGGIPKTKKFTDQASHGHLHSVPGTETSWLTGELKDYLKHKYPDSKYIPLDFSKNSVPQAKPGDVIFFDWNGDKKLDHASLVVDDAPGTKYPEVSEWGNVGGAGESSDTQKQGWTWSEYYNGWIEYSYPDPSAYLLHIDTGLDGVQVTGHPGNIDNYA